MGAIKKTFKLQTGTTGHYTFNIMLSADIKDLGFFDTSDDYDRSTYSGYTATTEYALFNTPYTVTGNSESRLPEIEKYVVSNDPWVKYYSGNSTTDGLLNYTLISGETTYQYRLGQIVYEDITPSGSTATTTTFTMNFSGYSPANFDNKFIVKYETKQNMVENPQVNKDVFILRQQQPVFEKNYRLRAVNGLNDTLNYAGGDYFTIYNNT